MNDDSLLVMVQRTDPDGTVHTYPWPRALAEADGLTIVNDKVVDEQGRRLETTIEPPATPGEPVTEPARPASKARPATETKEA